MFTLVKLLYLRFFSLIVHMCLLSFLWVGVHASLSLFVSWHFVCLPSLLFPPELPAYPACHLLVSPLLPCLDFYQCGPLGVLGTFLHCLLIPVAGMIKKLLLCFLSCQASQAVCQLLGPLFRLHDRFYFFCKWHHITQTSDFQPWGIVPRQQTVFGCLKQRQK